MRVLLFVLSVVAFLAGFATLASAKSAVHEILAAILFLQFCVLLTGSAIVEAISRLKRMPDDRPITAFPQQNAP